MHHFSLTTHFGDSRQMDHCRQMHPVDRAQSLRRVSVPAAAVALAHVCVALVEAVAALKLLDSVTER